MKQNFIQDGVGHVVDYIAKHFPQLFNVLKIADVDKPSCHPVCDNVTAYSVLNRNSGAVIRLRYPFFFSVFLAPVNALYLEMSHQDSDDIVT